MGYFCFLPEQGFCESATDGGDSFCLAPTSIPSFLSLFAQMEVKRLKAVTCITLLLLKSFTYGTKDMLQDQCMNNENFIPNNYLFQSIALILVET